MTRLSGLALCLVLCGCSFTKVIFQKPPEPSYASAEQRDAVLRPLGAQGQERWREANRRIVRALQKDHPDPWFRMKQEAFRSQVADLDRDLGGLSEYQVVLRWKRIFAALGDGHTGLWEGASYLRTWPIQTAFAGDALVITSVAKGQEAWLGARIHSVGGEPVEAYLRRLEGFLKDPVPSKRRDTLASLVPYGWAWLEALGQLPGGARSEIELETREGKRQVVPLDILPSADLHWRTLPVAKPLLRNLEPRSPYAFRLLQEDRTVYVRYRRCRDDQAEPMAAFMTRLVGACEGRPVARLVVDVRGNGGGSEWVSQPLLDWAAAHPAFRHREGLVVLTDAGTYSSGHGLARRLKQAGAWVAGAETGQPDNAFGQVHFTDLPGLKPVFGCSLRRFLWDKAHPEAWHRGLLPDLPLEPTRDDVMGVTDSVLDRVLARPFLPEAP